MVSAYSYIRFSTIKQQSGDSLRRQLEACEAYCESHNLVLSDESFKDLGVSAFHGKHRQKGALAMFIKAVEDGAITEGSYLIIESFDRLSREKVESVLQLFLRLRDLQINIVTLTDNQQYLVSEKLDMTQLITSIVIMSRAHEESETKSIRIRQAHQNTRNRIIRGERIWSGSHPPWLTLNTSRDEFVVIAERAKVVKEIFDMSLQNLGLTAIANDLKTRKVPTFDISRSKSKIWTRDHVLRILRNEKVTGLNIVDDVELPDHFPRVISDDVFYRSEQLMQRRRTNQGRKPKHKNYNAFRGILQCQCGGMMYSLRMTRNNKVYSYLKCRNNCKPSLQYPFFESSFFRLVPFINFDSVLVDDPVVDKAKDIESELLHLSSQIEKLADKALIDDLPKSLLKRLKSMELKHDELSQTLKNEHANESIDRKTMLSAMHTMIAELKVADVDRAYDIRKECNLILSDTFSRLEVKALKPCSFKLKCFFKDGNTFNLDVHSPQCDHHTQDFLIEAYFE